jgi:hypothetical protein
MCWVSNPENSGQYRVEAQFEGEQKMPRFIVERIEKCTKCKHYRLLTGKGQRKDDKLEVEYCLLSHKIITIAINDKFPKDCVLPTNVNKDYEEE